MKKALIWIIILVLLVVGYFVRQEYGNMASDGATNEEVLTGEILEDMMTGEVLTGEAIQPTDGGETGVDPEFIEQMEAQAEVGVTGEELTDEDIKLIEDILQQITDSVQE